MQKAIAEIQNNNEKYFNWWNISNLHQKTNLFGVMCHEKVIDYLKYLVVVKLETWRPSSLQN